MSYTIGIIGSGNIGRGLAVHLAKTAHKVLITNSRGADSLRQMVSAVGGSLSAAGLTETIQQSDVLFIAVPWNAVPELAPELSNHQGKILVDTTNHVISLNPFRFEDLGDNMSGERTAALFPAHHVIKAFNTLAAATLQNPAAKSKQPLVVFISGDDKNAKETVKTITEEMGFAPIDLGTLQEGGRLQDMNGGALSGLELAKLN